MAKQKETFKDEVSVDSRGKPPESAMKKRNNGDSESGEAGTDSQRSSFKEEDDNGGPLFASKEARAVGASKALVAFVLLLSASLLAYFSYTFSRNQEESEFQAKFLDYADEIRRSGINNAASSFALLRSFSRTITSFSAFSNETQWPFVTIPDYEVRAGDFRASSQAEEVAFAPMVPDTVREAYEAYTQRNQAWIQAGLDYEFMLSIMDKARHEQLQQEIAQGNDNQPSTVQPEQDKTIAPGTNMEGFSNINMAKPILPYIWKNAPLTHRAIPETNKGPNIPIWQTNPAPRNSYVVNRNLRSEPAFEDLIMKSINNNTAVLSDIIDNFALFGRSQSIDLDPKSVIMEPVMSSLQPRQNPEIKGFLIVVKKWDRLFRSVLYKGAEPITCILRNSCGKAFSYEIRGPQAIFLGEGDLHDPHFDDMVVQGSFTNTLVESTCDYFVQIYPTKEMEAAYKTNMPLYVTLAVMVVFGFTSLVFLLYDFLVTKRQKTTMASAQATNRIVSNLFPKAVRDRLIQEMEAQDADNNSAVSGNSGVLSNAGSRRNRKDKKGAFLNMVHPQNGSPGQHGKQGTGATSEDIFGSKPIAELFPETTIMFADMAGFTAWSSVREPTQVFTLLETIYHAFDQVAKRRRVFKVETIGDCYVAVCGLPMPRKDHAVVMGRFASECLNKMDLLTKELEASLGPDTADLTLRVGLHSGQVTAGVLRGEKGRFQLFGDTMNTASRMESTGQRGMIQVSAETAALIKQAGKDDWVTEREEKVHAKGKGELQTYWLRIGTKSDLASSVASNNDLLGCDKDEDTDADLDEGEAAKKAEAEDMKNEMALAAKTLRLIDWNAEILGKLLKQIVLRRAARRIKKKQMGLLGIVGAPAAPQSEITSFEVMPSGAPIDEVEEIISLPHYDPKNFAKNVDPDSVEIPEAVLIQLKAYVSRIASLYRDNPFHNFDHASHVTMSVTKLLSRIVNPLQGEGHAEQNKLLHDHTFGITSDPLTQFTCVLSALIHDADHPGVGNSVLVKEQDAMAVKYKELSIAEQNSVDLAWQILMEDQFQDLRGSIYTTEDEFKRFRQILVNIVLATDIMDKNLGAQRKARWNKAFSVSAPSDHNLDINGLHHDDDMDSSETNQQRSVNRKATIVLEHLIQASDVSHTMQHWHVYLKWNEKLFHELYKAFLEGRLDSDPSQNWYKGEIGFFDFYIIPLAKKLETCGVFGVSSLEYLSYADANRREWERKGESIVQEYLKKYKKGE